MNDSADHSLYDLLPAIYQIEDAKRGEPLKQLLAIVAAQRQILEADISALYENWFIETCDDWVVPYIGDLVSAGDLSAKSVPIAYGRQHRRAYVANTLAYRRRKGTAPVVEQLVRDVTDWRSRVVEFFQQLALTQHLDSIRPQRTTVNLRSPSILQGAIASPFEEQLVYSADLRGRYNISNLGIFIWRLQSYPIAKVTARSVEVPGLEGRCFRLSPLDRDLALFNNPVTETNITHLAEEINVPGPLPAARLHPAYSPAYSHADPPWQIFINGQPQPLPWEQIAISPIKSTAKGDFPDLDPEKQIVVDPELEKLIFLKNLSPKKQIIVDPELGKLLFLKEAPTRVEVSYTYGFSGDIGGGSYSRASANAQPSGLFWEVERENRADPNPLATAVDRWNQTVTAWQACQEKRAIVLAHLTTAAVRTSRESLPRSSFTPGVISGLKVIAEVEAQEIIVTPGSAIDRQGRIITLDRTLSIALKSVQQTYLLVIAHADADPSVDTSQNKIVCQLIPLNQSDLYPSDTYLRLLQLEVSVNNAGKGELHKASAQVRMTLEAGIAQGFAVLVPSDRLEAILTPGTAIDRQGKQILLDRNIAIDLRPYQGQNIALLLPYATHPTRSNWQPTIILKSEFDKLNENSLQKYIPLIVLDVPLVTVEAIGEELEKKQSQKKTSLLRPTFIPGIIHGLEVQGETGGNTVTISPGLAVDKDGQTISLRFTYRLRRLWRYFNRTVPTTVTLAIAHQGRQAQIRVFSDVADIPENYLKLATFSINSNGRLIQAPQHDSPTFQPGIVNGLNITPPKPAKATAPVPSASRPGIVNGLDVTPQPEDTSSKIVTVSAGKAVNTQGELIELDAACTIDLARYPGGEFILFIANPRKQGWQPLDVVTHGTDPVWQKLGIVPPLPDAQKDKIGTILIKDNSTYAGDLKIIIPADRQLKILAASGVRPHIWGNISVWGSARDQARDQNERADSQDPEPGELKLNGLLIEGKLTVLPGNLKFLNLLHCTLVPAPDGGLTVEPSWAELAEQEAQNSSDKAEEERWLVIAIALYWLQLLRQMVQLSFDPRLPAQQRLQQVTQFALTEARRIWEDLRQIPQQLPPLPSCWPDQGEGLGANSELEITLDHCISGPIQLSRTVFSLAIANSIIDKGAENTLGGVAIQALGTAVTIAKSTLFGSTLVRSLSARDSIFDEVVTVLDRQIGCLHFCYVPDASQIPVFENCQPDRAVKLNLPTLPPAITALAANRGWIFAGTAGEGTYFALTDPGIFLIYLLIMRMMMRGEFYRFVLFLIKHYPFYSGRKWQQELAVEELAVEKVYITTLYASSDPAIILAGTLGGKVLKFNDDNFEWTEISNNQLKVAVNAIIIYQGDIIVGTAGNGAWSYPLRNLDRLEGNNWISLNLDNRDITAFTTDANGNLFAGTDGEGVFRYLKDENCWQSANQGLTNRQITALTSDQDQGEIFAGTNGGGVFYSNNAGLSWASLAQIWANPDFIPNAYVTSLLAYAQDGEGKISGNRGKNLKINYSRQEIDRISRQGTTVNRIKIDELKIGDRIIAANQTRIITDIRVENSETATVTLNEAFSGDLPPEGVNYRISHLLVGTVGGGIDNRWHSLNNNSTARHITSLIRTPTPNGEIGEIFAGTAYGGILRSQDQGSSWEAVNSGLAHEVDKKLTILARLQPSFTSRQYGESAYAQLNTACPPEIRRGAEDGSEMGVFNFLAQSQREDNLQVSLKEYVRFGLDNKIFYMT